MNRLLKVNELIKQQLGQIILTEVEFEPGTIVTITRVETLPDLKQAKVLVSVLPASAREQAIKILNREANNLQQLLNEKIILRIIPKLNFLVDDSEERAAEIERLLDNLK